MKGIINVVGLGPGDFGLITMESWEKISSAHHLKLRTAIHPTVEELDKRGIKYTSYDSYYETGKDFNQVYTAIVKDLLKQAQTCGEIVYAVPGSPAVAERTVMLLREQAPEAGVTLNILPGMSFMEVLYQRLNIDPIDGLAILDACDAENILAADAPLALVVTQVYDQMVASDLKLTLMEYYPEDFPVTFIRNLSLEDEEIREIPLYELDRQKNIDHLTSIYLGKLPAGEKTFDLTPLQDIIARLRQPDGCPWDIVQTHESIRKNLIEETYEVLEAIDLKDRDLLCEELGDLLMQIVFHARMAEEANYFSMEDVIQGVVDKLIRRHPHVFGEVTLKDAAAVLDNWEKIKAVEKTERTSVLDGIPKDLPALMTAYKLQHKASKVGFDWSSIEPMWDKVHEEIDELKEAIAQKDKAAMEDELGDVFFALVNIARFLKLDPELALRSTNRKFTKRFHFIEAEIKAANKNFQDYSLAELDKIWEKAKKA